MTIDEMVKEFNSLKRDEQYTFLANVIGTMACEAIDNYCYILAKDRAITAAHFALLKEQLEEQ